MVECTEHHQPSRVRKCLSQQLQSLHGCLSIAISDSDQVRAGSCKRANKTAFNGLRHRRKDHGNGRGGVLERLDPNLVSRVDDGWLTGNRRFRKCWDTRQVLLVTHHYDPDVTTLKQLGCC